MRNIREVKCRVVTCKTCAYTHFKPLEICVSEQHDYHWHDGLKRFFKCPCGNRSISLDRLPKKHCSNCGLYKWERDGMLKEKTGPKIGGETLLPRGEEHGKFLNSLKWPRLQTSSYCLPCCWCSESGDWLWGACVPDRHPWNKCLLRCELQADTNFNAGKSGCIGLSCLHCRGLQCCIHGPNTQRWRPGQISWVQSGCSLITIKFPHFCGHLEADALIQLNCHPS